MPLFSSSVDADRSLALHARLQKATPDAWERIITERVTRVPKETDGGKIIYVAAPSYRVTIRYARGEDPLETEWLPSPEEAIASLETLSGEQSALEKGEPIN